VLLEQPHYQVLWLLLIMVSGLFPPVVLDRVVSKTRYIRTLPLGKRTWRRRPGD